MNSTPAPSPRRSISRGRRAPWLGASLVAGLAVVAVSGCTEQKSYDISPIFPLTADTCDTYHGDQEGEGFAAHCWVTKSECERAVSDWNQSMQDNYVDDAIRFSCD